MRCGERCPRCGYVETTNWIPSTWAVDEDVAPKSEADQSDSQWAYRESRDVRYVRRILQAVLKSRNGIWRLRRDLWDSAKHQRRVEALAV